MRLMGHKESYLLTDEQTPLQLTYEYIPKKSDYFLKYHVSWDYAVAEYLVSINKHKYLLPSGVFVMVAEPTGEQDWIYIDDLLAQNIDVIELDSEFMNWSLSKVELIDKVETEIYFPNTKQVIPIGDETGEYSILVSKSDHYHTMKTDSFFDVLVG